MPWAESVLSAKKRLRNGNPCLHWRALRVIIVTDKSLPLEHHLAT